ncbi:hypothetical protein NW767_002696 [Fusarium falciforme]|uniref:Uncharacterized protein n=1 Tax=Fusarium falciforme TaxID=195108 RepID=A0A9W8V6E8_9HYPO|nr:hypothetical protein NW755_002440 [Fusarium falciforme]KAJ4207446.1 hypothetical protein NW767_002696 [Fusarium falciforme]KAJ4244935.1 hypothetical protein NW757_010319 [Fusarium falciforme]
MRSRWARTVDLGGSLVRRSGDDYKLRARESSTFRQAGNATTFRCPRPRSQDPALKSRNVVSPIPLPAAAAANQRLLGGERGRQNRFDVAATGVILGKVGSGARKVRLGSGDE